MIAELSDLCRREQIETKCFTHLRVVYPENHELILRAMAEEQRTKAEKLLEASRRLGQAIKTVPFCEVKFRKILSAYRLRYLWLKQVGSFLKDEMEVDLRSALKKVYGSLKSCEASLENSSRSVTEVA